VPLVTADTLRNSSISYTHTCVVH